VVIKEKLYNAKLVKDWCIGFDDLSEHVQDCTPKWAEGVTWIDREQIIEAARLFAKTKPSCLHSRLGAGAQHVNATQTARAVSIFMVLAADLDVPGGNLLTHKLGGFKVPDEIAKILRPPSEVELRRIGAREYPIISGTKETAHFLVPQCHTPTAIRAMLDKRIRALYVPGCNLAVMEGDSRQTCQALRSLDFLAVADFFLTPTAELADLVLPPAHWLETESPLRAYQVMGPRRYNHILAPKKVVDPRGQCWDNRKIILELAKRLEAKIPWENVDDFNDWILEHVGVRFKDIQKKPSQMLSFPLRYKTYEESGFNTPSGKIELRSTMLENLGYEPIPKFYEPPESPVSKPELAKEYPMILITHRKAIYMHSESRQLPSFRKLEPDPVIELSTEAAAKLGIKDSDEIWIERPGFEHRVRGKAKLVERLHPSVVSMVPGWWFPEKPDPEHGMFDSNINTIISNGPPYDPINGNHQARAIPCRVGKG